MYPVELMIFQHSNTAYEAVVTAANKQKQYVTYFAPIQRTAEAARDWMHRIRDALEEGKSVPPGVIAIAGNHRKPLASVERKEEIA